MKFFKFSALIYILLIHCVLALVFLRPDIKRDIEVKLGIPSSQIAYFRNKMLGFHRGMDGSIPDNAVLFIGDSITQSLATSAVSPLSVNLGIGSDTTSGVLSRLGTYKSINRAHLIVVGVGINDIHQGVDHADTLNNFKNILTNIPSSKTVVVTAVLPIGVSAEKSFFSNVNIISLNDKIENVIREHENVSFLDTHSAFLDDAGYMKAAFHNGDGVHLSDEGYALLIKLLKSRLTIR